MKNFIILICFSLLFLFAIGQDSIENLNPSHEKIVNLGGTIENFPKVPVVPDLPSGGGVVAGKASFDELYSKGLESVKSKALPAIPLSSYYTGDKFSETRPGTDPEKMKLPVFSLNNPDLINFLIIIFIIVGSILLWLKVNKVGYLKSIIRNTYNFLQITKSKEKDISSDNLNIVEKIKALNELENLLKSGAISEKEFAKLKSEIFV